MDLAKSRLLSLSRGSEELSFIAPAEAVLIASDADPGRQRLLIAVRCESALSEAPLIVRKQRRKLTAEKIFEYALGARFKKERSRGEKASFGGSRQPCHTI